MYKLAGTWKYAAGAAGTVTLPQGSVLLQAFGEDATGGGTATVQIFGGAVALLPTYATPMRFMHRLNVAPAAPNNTIIFTGTTSYFVEYILAGNI
jgi:hypothetical protein